MAFVKDLTIEKGRYFKRIFTFFEDKEKTQPVKLSGMNFKSQCRSGATHLHPEIFEFNCGIEGDPDFGAVFIEVFLNQTKDINFAGGFYDIVEINSAKTYVKGEITFEPSVTEITITP